MKYFMSITCATGLFFIGHVQARDVRPKQNTTTAVPVKVSPIMPQQSPQIAIVAPITTSPIIPQQRIPEIKSYAELLAMVQAKQPVANDYPLLMNFQEEINRQIAMLQVNIKQASEKPGQKIFVPKQPISAVVVPSLMQTYLLPTDANILKRLDLCPLFTQPALYFVFKEQRLLSSGKTALGFEGDDVAINAPCMVALGKFGNWNRTLMQLKSLNQFELADVTGLDPALCAGHSLNNGRLIRKYALTGNVQNLIDMHNVQNSANFLIDLKIGAWLNVEVVRAKFAQLRSELGNDGVDVSAISTVSLFDPYLDKKFGFSVFDENEFAYAQNVKKNIEQGLKKENYVHIMIIGNEETVEEALGHYFCFAIIKKGNTIQYVVLDTVPRAYHLQQGSHERDRLMFIIQHIEQGNSLINVANIRTKRLQIMEEDRLKSLNK